MGGSEGDSTLPRVEMFSLLAVVCLVFSFAVLVLTFRWISHLRAGRAWSHHPEAGPPVEVEEEPLSSGAVMIHGANYGLILGILSCLLFKLSLLMLFFSLSGMFFSGRALWEGLYRYRIILFRALVGMGLSVGSVGLHYLNIFSEVFEWSKISELVSKYMR